VWLNSAARQLLCTNGASVILGQPLDVGSAGSAPLAELGLAETLAIMVGSLRRGATPEAIEVVVGNETRRSVRLQGRPLGRQGRRAGGVIILSGMAANEPP
jgi:hypothetical protein